VKNSIHNQIRGSIQNKNKNSLNQTEGFFSNAKKKELEPGPESPLRSEN
jgi:hypothetical protein